MINHHLTNLSCMKGEFNVEAELRLGIEAKLKIESDKNDELTKEIISLQEDKRYHLLQ